MDLGDFYRGLAFYETMTLDQIRFESQKALVHALNSPKKALVPIQGQEKESSGK